MTDLAVVLIAKNQEWSVARLIESVLERTSFIPSREIVLVDSASTDRTIEIASQYPINIVRLLPDQQLTPAAGRYVGYKRTQHKFVLFLDGDMELHEGWLEHALRLLHKEPDIAVLTGRVIDLPKTTESYNHYVQEHQHQPDLVTDVLHGGGAALYRRDVLEQVGTFNPYLCSDEEPELCLRIRSAGYRVSRIEHPIALHYTDPIEDFVTLIRRWRRNLYVGSGQNIRYHLSTGLLWAYLKERGHGLPPFIGLAVGLASLLASLISHRVLWFTLWLLLVAVFIVIDAVRKRSLYRTFHSLLKRLLILDGTLRGLLHPPYDPDGYPAKFEVVK
jgi:glycosyltransferase involved in cell wall biosynthesis